MPRGVIPDLQTGRPVCTVCLTSRHMRSDDASFWCGHCAISWNQDGTDGRWEE